MDPHVRAKRHVLLVADKDAVSHLRGCAKNFFSQNPRLLWKWVGGSRSHLEFLFFENHPKIALNQY